MFYKDDRLALFIDGSNLYAAAKALGFDIDYKLLRQEFMRRGKLLRAFYYTALLENDEYSPIRPLVDWLHYNGFSMVTKPAKEYTDSQGRRKVKGNMDIELTVDAMELAPRELSLLQALLGKPGHAIAKERLFELVFPGEQDVQYEAIEVVAYRLRKRLVGTGVELVTLRGLGYLLRVQGRSEP